MITIQDITPGSIYQLIGMEGSSIPVHSNINSKSDRIGFEWIFNGDEFVALEVEVYTIYNHYYVNAFILRTGTMGWFYVCPTDPTRYSSTEKSRQLVKVM